jgi:hypothetical protein
MKIEILEEEQYTCERGIGAIRVTSDIRKFNPVVEESPYSISKDWRYINLYYDAQTPCTNVFF